MKKHIVSVDNEVPDPWGEIFIKAVMLHKGVLERSSIVLVVNNTKKIII